MKKKIKITPLSLAVVAVLGIGGTFVAKTEYDKLMAHVEASRAKTQKAAEKKQQEKKMTTKEKQVAYLKEHQQEIVDFVKAQSSQIESVQIDWEETHWADSGFSDGEVLQVFGRVNNIEDSGWRVDFPINDDKSVDLDGMYLGLYVKVGEDHLE